MNMDEFIDLCILCGCDYTKSIGGIGPIKAFKLIQEEGTIEKVLDKVKEINEDDKRKQKFIIPDNFLYQESRELFKKPFVDSDKEKFEQEIKWNKPDDDGIRDFLINQKAFAENKVESGLKKLQGSQSKVNQSRLDLFFKSAGFSSSGASQKKDAGGAKGPRKSGSVAGRGRGGKR